MVKYACKANLYVIKSIFLNKRCFSGGAFWYEKGFIGFIDVDDDFFVDTDGYVFPHRKCINEGVFLPQPSSLKLNRIFSE